MTTNAIEKPPAGAPRPPSFGRILLIIAVALLGVLFLGRQMMRSLPQAPLPVIAQTTGALQVTERDGRTVKLAELRGKVTVMACLYTVCPHGCAAVVAQMQKLNTDFGSRPDFHQVSLSVAPERDTTGFLRAYAEGVGVKSGDPWWFVSGDRQQTWDYMTHELQMQAPAVIPEEKRVNPLDLYEHDLRIVLIDRSGRVRGFYAAFHPQPEIAEVMTAKLHKDVRRLLDDPNL